MVHILGLGLIAVVCVTSYFLLRYPYRGLKNVFSVRDLGTIEGDFDNLREVVIVADHVEAPSDELRSAVEKNFERGVKYQFLVSQSKAQEELDLYYGIFEVLAKIASKRSQSAYSVHDLVSIQQLPYEWVEVPYVFYKVSTDQPSPYETQYIAVRGNQKKHGIADFYSIVEPDYAHMMARGILSDAPRPIVVEREQFRESNYPKLATKLGVRQS